MVTRRSAQAHDVEAQEQRHDLPNEKKTALVSAAEDDGSAAAPEPRPAHKTLYMAAFIDVLIALLPLYFVAFAVLARSRDSTLASSYRNYAILRLAKLNPTFFPIVFALIMAKFLKAYANFRLERSATIGLIQHLLGSRSLVSSVITPVKLRTSSFLVPLLILMWLLNPIGGQTSLRVATKDSENTIIQTPFQYVDVHASRYLPDNDYQRDSTNLISALMNAALSSPMSSKTSTQDIYHNLQIPMLEPLVATGSPDHGGWYEVSHENDEGLVARLLKATGTTPDLNPKLTYSALLGLPITRGDNISVEQDTTGASGKMDFLQYGEDIRGPDIVSTNSLFTLETSYIKADCKVQRSAYEPKFLLLQDAGNASMTNWNGSHKTVDNGRGLTIAYDAGHSENSTRPRRIGIESWRGHAIQDRQLTTEPVLSEAWCDITTTFIEVEAHCLNGLNCTVARVRESRKAKHDSNLTRLDFSPRGAEFPTESYETDWVASFFGSFVNSTAHTIEALSWVEHLTPLECYFVDPVFPHVTSAGEAPDLYIIGDELFSLRLAQLLNTFWLASIAPYTVIEGLVYDTPPKEEMSGYPTSNLRSVFNDGTITSSQGRFIVETSVLRCHSVYFAVLLCVSTLLFAAGLATAYLDATRRGPDILDDFVNSLTHSPYVHVDRGPSMEDGQEKARRLRATVIQMGDVDPQSDHGYVAIATPNERQPVQRLDHKRYYL